VGCARCVRRSWARASGTPSWRHRSAWAASQCAASAACMASLARRGPDGRGDESEPPGCGVRLLRQPRRTDGPAATSEQKRASPRLRGGLIYDGSQRARWSAWPCLPRYPSPTVLWAPGEACSTGPLRRLDRRPSRLRCQDTRSTHRHTANSRTWRRTEVPVPPGFGVLPRPTPRRAAGGLKPSGQLQS
jgi:hypothetical protein